jgi:hypothetical protein
VSLYRIFSHYLIKNVIFEKKVIEYEMCVSFSLQHLLEIFLILRKIQ